MKDQTDYQELLDQALSEPGTISQCYSHFWRYSVGNQLEIMGQLMAQGRELQPVGSYKAWQSVGRQVPRGTKASIAIWKPRKSRSGKCKACDDGMAPDGSACKVCKGTGQRSWFPYSYSLCLFPLEDTEGDEVNPLQLETPDWSAYQCMLNTGIEWEEYSDIDGNVQGYAVENRVSVNPIGEHPERTIIHEMAHVLLGHTKTNNMVDLRTGLEHSEREVEAELVSYIVAESLGIEGGEASRGYIQGYLAGVKIDDARIKVIFQVATDILRAGWYDGVDM